MEKIEIREVTRVYKNNGQHLEQCVRFTLTGEIKKADNIPAVKEADVLNIQIKTARASICKGTDLKAYLDMDAAERYLYVTKNRIAYLMNEIEYYEFCKEFTYQTVDSKKNGGAVKLRLKSESRKLVNWLEKRL